MTKTPFLITTLVFSLTSVADTPFCYGEKGLGAKTLQELQELIYDKGNEIIDETISTHNVGGLEVGGRSHTAFSDYISIRRPKYGGGFEYVTYGNPVTINPRGAKPDQWLGKTDQAQLNNPHKEEYCLGILYSLKAAKPEMRREKIKLMKAGVKLGLINSSFDLTLNNKRYTLPFFIE